jgi:hypothetical protein
MVPKATHLHLRQAEIGAITGAPDGIPEADAADRAVDDLPDRHGHALADADGVFDIVLDPCSLVGFRQWSMRASTAFQRLSRRFRIGRRDDSRPLGCK